MMVCRVNPRSFLRELLIAIVIMFNAICLFVNEIMTSVSNFGDVLIILVMLLGMVNCLMSRRILLRRFLLINASILLWMIGSYVSYDYNQDILSLLKNYFVWGIIITFFMTLEYDIQKTLDIALLLSAVILLVDLIYNGVEHYEVMTWTYSVLPCLCVSFAHMFLSQGQFGRLRWLLYIPAIIMLFRFLSEANRGGWVSLIVLFYLLTAKTKIRNESKLRNRVLWNVLFLTLLAIAVFFYKPIITALYKLITAKDIRIYSIEKMYRGILADNITNNRTELYEFAWKGFLSSPIWGHGIGAFAVNHGGWPHNFFLQLLYEGGIMLFLLVLIPLTRIVSFVVRSNRVTPAEYALFVCFFTNSIPKLLVSAQVWNVQGFWLLLAFGMMLLTRAHHSAQEEIA